MGCADNKDFAAANDTANGDKDQDIGNTDDHGGHADDPHQENLDHTDQQRGAHAAKDQTGHADLLRSQAAHDGRQRDLGTDGQVKVARRHTEGKAPGNDTVDVGLGDQHGEFSEGSRAHRKRSGSG